MRDAVIVEAIRTPIGKRNGGLSGVHAVDLSAHVLRSLADRSGIDPGLVDDVIWGCVGQVGEQTFDVARNAVLAAGWPESVPGVTIDRQCGSSQQSVHFAAAGLIAGQYDLVVAGGVESMSRVPMGATLQVAGNPFTASGWTARYGEVMPNQGVGAEMMAEAVGPEPHPTRRVQPRVARKGRGRTGCGPLRRPDRSSSGCSDRRRAVARGRGCPAGRHAWLRWAHCVRRSPRTAWSPPAMPARSPTDPPPC